MLFKPLSVENDLFYIKRNADVSKQLFHFVWILLHETNLHYKLEIKWLFKYKDNINLFFG